jgi:hypothetical protein
MEASCDRKAELDCEHYTDRQFILSSNICFDTGAGDEKS